MRHCPGKINDNAIASGRLMKRSNRLRKDSDEKEYVPPKTAAGGSGASGGGGGTISLMGKLVRQRLSNDKVQADAARESDGDSNISADSDT